MKKITIDRKLRIRRRVRDSIFGKKDVPRISVFRSNKYIYGQAVDDDARKTVAVYSSLALKKGKEVKKGNKTDEAKVVGAELGKRLKAKKIERAVFDRNAYQYKGRVKALCEGLREAGITI